MFVRVIGGSNNFLHDGLKLVKKRSRAKNRQRNEGTEFVKKTFRHFSCFNRKLLQTLMFRSLNFMTVVRKGGNKLVTYLIEKSKIIGK